MSDSDSEDRGSSPCGRIYLYFVLRLMKKLLFLILVLSVSGCSTSNSISNGQLSVQVRNSDRTAMDKELEKSSQAMHHFLLGELQYDNQDFDSALENFESASRLVNEPAPVLHVKLTELFVRSGQLDKAIEEIERAQKQNPEDTDVMLLYAGVLEARGRADESEPIYRKLIEIKPTSIDSYILLSSLQLKKKDYDTAIKTLEKYLKTNPYEPVALTMLARAHEIKGDLKEAEKILIKAQKSDPNNTAISVESLRINIKLKKFNESKKICNQIIEKDPNNIVARKILGQLLMGENKFEEALQHLQILERVEVDSSDTRFKIALIQIGKQNFKEAITELNLVLAGDPEYPEARYYLASSYVASGRKKEAIEELLKIKTQDKMYVQSRTLAAFLLRQEKDFEASEDAIREAYKAKPDDLSIISYMVIILRDIGNLSEAKSLLEDTIKKHPGNDKILFNYATLLVEFKKHPEAIDVLEKIVAANPKNADAMNFLAYELAETKTNLDHAETMVRKALELKPNDGYYMDTLGWILYLKSNFKEAVTVLGRASAITAEDPVIVEHYVEALLKSGDKERALEQLKIGINKKSSAVEPEAQRAVERMESRLKELSSAQ